MDNTECPHCKKQCIPKLWHYRPAFGAFRYMATQHLCPFCCGVMYQSGGQLSILGWLAAIFFGGAFAVAIVAQLFKSRDITEVIGGVASVALWGFIAYKLYRRFWK